jgi:uncharacterized membrane protein
MARRKSKKPIPKFDLETVSTQATAWVGSVGSLVVHTFLFGGAFVLGLLGVDWDRVLLILTTVVSLEAIYLAIFIQMTVNRNTASLKEVEQDIDEIQHDVDAIQEDVGEIQEDVDEIQQDVDEVQQDMDEIQEEVIEITELERQDDKAEDEHARALESIHEQIAKLTQAITELKR